MTVSEELRTYLLVLWRNKWLIAAGAIVAALVALGISLKLTPRYEATATVRVASAPGGTDDYIYLISLTRLSNTYVEIASMDIHLNEVAEQLGLQDLPKVQIETMPDTELILITATNTDPVLARDIANTTAGLMVEQSTQLYGGNAPTMRELLDEQLQQARVELDNAVAEYDNALRLSQSAATPSVNSTPIPNSSLETLSQLVGLRQQIYNQLLIEYEDARTNEQFRANAITIVEPAYLPEKPTTPSMPLNAALGLAAGSAIAGMLAFVLEGLDGSIRGIEDVPAITSLPILCKVPVLRRRSGLNARINLISDQILFPLAVIDQLCTRLRLFDDIPSCATLVITSPESGTGKSTFAANCAVSLAGRGKKVVLVDLDFHRPTSHYYLGLMNKIGASNVLHGEAQWDEALQATAYPNLQVITSGSSIHTPYESVTTQAIGDLFEKLSSQFDYVLVDMPGLPRVIDPNAWFSQVDTIILVVALHKTQRQNFRYALQQMDEFKSKISGIVINKAASPQRYGY